MERLELVKIDYRNRDEKLIEPDFFDEEVGSASLDADVDIPAVRQMSQIRDLHIMQ